MEIVTSQFGKIKFSEVNIINFEAGIIGFENLKNYILLKKDEEFFYWLNSIEEPEIAFPLFGLRVIDDSYPASDNNEPFGIVTLNKEPLQVTINLKAPVYLDQERKKGVQKILDDENYPLNYKLFKEDP